MSAAACTLPVDRQGDWLGELGSILDNWDAMPPAARAAVDATINSFLVSPETSERDVAELRSLLARADRRLLRQA